MIYQYLRDQENLPPVTLAVGLCRTGEFYELIRVTCLRKTDESGRFYLDYKEGEIAIRESIRSIGSAFIGWLFECQPMVILATIRILSTERVIDVDCFQPIQLVTLEDPEGRTYKVRMSLEVCQDIKAIRGPIDDDVLAAEIVHVIWKCENDVKKLMTKIRDRKTQE